MVRNFHRHVVFSVIQSVAAAAGKARPLARALPGLEGTTHVLASGDCLPRQSRYSENICSSPITDFVCYANIDRRRTAGGLEQNLGWGNRSDAPSEYKQSAYCSHFGCLQLHNFEISKYCLPEFSTRVCLSHHIHFAHASSVQAS